MEKIEKIKVTNTKQFEKLVEELEKNPSLARGFRRGAVPSNFKGQWDDIANMLNAFGPPRRAGDGWQKVWRDLKFKVKKKMIANKAECNATGGGIFKQIALSPLEEAVANLLQFEKHLNPEGTCQGVLTENHENQCEVMDRDAEVSEAAESSGMNLCNVPEVPSTSGQMQQQTAVTNSTKRKTNSKVAIKKNRQQLLERHSNKQAKILTEMSNTLSSIKRSLRDGNKYQQRLLQLMEERNKREVEAHQSNLKLVELKILIKEKELGLLIQNQN